MSRHNCADRVLRQTTQVASQRSTHAGRTRINQESVIQDRREEFSKENWHDVARHAAQKEHREFASGKIQATAKRGCMGSALADEIAQSCRKNQRQADEEANDVARPECAKEGFLPDLMHTRYAAGASAAFADGVSVAGDEFVCNLADPAKWRYSSEPADQERGWEQSGQFGNGSPTAPSFTTWCKHVQFAEAFFDRQLRIDCGQQFRVDWNGEHSMVTVEDSQPGNE